LDFPANIVPEIEYIYQPVSVPTDRQCLLAIPVLFCYFSAEADN